MMAIHELDLSKEKLGKGVENIGDNLDTLVTWRLELKKRLYERMNVEKMLLISKYREHHYPII